LQSEHVITFIKNTSSFFGSIASSMLFVCLFVAIGNAADIEINANYLEYDEVAHYMVATGSVTISWEDKVLKGEQVRIWVEKKYLVAEDKVVFLENKNVLYADKLAYDYQADSAIITNASGRADPQYFSTEQIVRKGSTTYETGRIAVTTCDLARPHYLIRARRAKITLNKRITLYHPVFYLKKVPVFYLPIFSTALGSHRANLEISPGYNNQDGLTLKTIYGYPFSDQLYGKLYLDDLGKRGWGEGGELTYSTATLRGTVYAYHLDDKRDMRESLTLRSEYWQKLNPQWLAQGEMDYVTNNSYNDSQYIENNRIDMRVHSFGALTRQGKISNLRVVVESYDVYDPISGMFVSDVVTLPSLAYTLYPQKWNMPFYTSFSAFVQNQYTRASGVYTMNGNTDLNVTRDIRLSRQVTYKPQVGVRVNWVNREPGGALSDQFLTSYYTNNNIRLRLLRWMDWDLSHSWVWQTQTNSLVIDPNGEATNALNYVNTMSFGKLRVKDSIGYNLHLYRITTVEDWRTPFTPLVNEIYWSPRPTVSVFGREENSIYPYQINSVQLDSRFGQLDKRYVNVGAFYQSVNPNNLDFTTGVGFWPTTKWKIDYALHWTSVNNFDTLIANDHELKIYRDLHCWEVKLTYRHRPDGQEDINFQIGLKSSAKDKKRYPTRDAKEFYPWR